MIEREDLGRFLEWFLRTCAPEVSSCLSKRCWRERGAKEQSRVLALLASGWYAVILGFVFLGLRKGERNGQSFTEY